MEMGYNAAFHWGKLEEDRLSSRTHIRTNTHSCIQWSAYPYTQTRTHIRRNDGMLSHRLGGPLDCCTLGWESGSWKINPTDKTDYHTDIVAEWLQINWYAYSWLQLSCLHLKEWIIQKWKFSLLTHCYVVPNPHAVIFFCGNTKVQ